VVSLKSRRASIEVLRQPFDPAFPRGTTPDPPGKSFPARIPYPSLPPPGSPNEEKTGGDKTTFHLPSLFLSVIFLLITPQQSFQKSWPPLRSGVISISSKGGTYEDTAVEAIRATNQER
jgi:hypothetical protein